MRHALMTAALVLAAGNAWGQAAPAGAGEGFVEPPADMVPARRGGTLPTVVRAAPPAQPAPAPTLQANPAPVQPTVAPQPVQAPPPVQGPVPPPPPLAPQGGAGFMGQGTAGTFQAQPGQPAMLQMQSGQSAQPANPNARMSPEQRDDHFMRALEGLITLTPGQAAQTRRAADEFGRAAARPSAPPAPVTRSITMTLRPGEPIPLLRTFPGNTTNLTFADGSGAPWPVQTVVSGNPNALNVQRAAPDGVPTNIVVLSPLQQFAFSNNVVVTLVGNPVPIIFAVETGNSPQVDFRVDVNLRGRGPNSPVDAPAATASLSPTNDATMQAFVDGIAPPGSRRLFSSRPDVEAWRHNDIMYVRTPLELLSPAATGRATHVSGVKVYSLMYSPVLVLSQNGQRVRVTIDDRREGGRR